jgi:dihydroorotase
MQVSPPTEEGTTMKVDWKEDSPTRIEFDSPDDWHVHLRDGEALKTTVPHTAAQFARAIIMPNLKPPVTTTAMALAYKERIMAHVPEGVEFEPLMTLYLTDDMSPDEIKRAKDAGIVAVKLYPAGATTNSAAGVTDIRKTYATLEMMQREGILLLVHGEVTDPSIDLFDREAVFIDSKLRPLRADLPELKIVLEHITTQEAMQYVCGSEEGIAATITAHHLLYNRNAIFTGGIRPHYYCLPVLKREVHRQALGWAAASGNPRFFLGTDSAPHAAHLKEHALGCAGCYTAPTALELYVEAYMDIPRSRAIIQLEGFASHFGADFYGLPRSPGKVVIERGAAPVPESYQFGEAVVKPLRSGETLEWKARRM